MSIYPRPDEKVFAENSLPGETVDFPDIQRGWGITFDLNGGFPPLEWTNALAKRQDQAIRYLLQHGVPEWSPTESYPASACVQEDGRTWKSTTANTGMRPSTSPSSWVSWGLSAADLQNAYSTFSTDTGTANTVVAAFWPAITALADGMQLRVKIKSTNTGAVTCKVNDLPARAIVGLAGSALQGGELVANGRATLMYSATSDSFVLLSCEGGAMQIPDGTKSHHAVSLGQMAAANAGLVPFTAFQGANQSQAVSGYQKLPGGLIMQWGQAAAAATAGQPTTITLPIANPVATRSITITRTGGAAGADFNTFTISDITTTNFVVRAQVSGSPTFFWMAIGH